MKYDMKIAASLAMQLIEVIGDAEVDTASAALESVKTILNQRTIADVRESYMNNLLLAAMPTDVKN